MNAATTDCLLTNLAFPEGPAFAPDGSLWLVELKGGCLVRLKPNGQLTRFAVGGQPNGIAIDAPGRIWFCDAGQNAIRRFDPATHRLETLAETLDGQPLDKPNDLAFDATGNLVFTCPGNSRRESTGYVCVLLPDGRVRKIADGLYFPNGLAFDAEGRHLFIAETYRHRIWKGRWNAPTAEWTNARVWCEVGGPDGPGGPDGMAIDEQGNLYVAVYGTGEIRVVGPAGHIHEHLRLPGQNPTNCAFIPADPPGLVITEAEHGQVLRLPTPAKGSRLFTGLPADRTINSSF